MSGASVPCVQPEIGGIGIVSACGRGMADTMARLRDGDMSPQPPLSIVNCLEDGPPVYEVPERVFAAATHRLPAGKGRRSHRIARLAAADAFESVPEGASRVRIGVVVGTTVTGIRHAEDWVDADARGGRDRVAARSALRHVPLQSLPTWLARELRCTGPAFAVSTACTSGTQAIVTAAGMIASGRCDIVLAGGVDSLARLTYLGFESLGLLAPTRCAPFDGARAGLTLGEGAAFVLLGRPGTFETPLGVLEGWGSSADAFHATAPRPDGSGVRRVLSLAIERSGRSPDEIDWVHAHGTGTRTNDVVEARAIQSELPAAPYVSSTKHLFGHTLAAAGAVATVVALGARSSSFVPGNAPITTSDPEIDLTPVPPAGVSVPVRRVLVNSLGFGGTNCALVVGEGTR